MSKLVRLVGTFSPVPGATGFVLPIFRAETSDMPMVQVIDHKGVVSALVHGDVSPIDVLYGQNVWTGIGYPAVYAVRMPKGGLEAGTREHLAQVLFQPIESGEFDTTPVTRFRLSAFLRLGARLAADAQTALTWVGSTSTPWAADNWKVEGTIVPEFSRRIEFSLKEAGESDEVVQWACRGIQVKVHNDGRLALSVAVPGEGAEATRCRDILTKASESLIGEASEWWPELRGNRPRVVIPPPPAKPEPDRLPVWIIFATEDKPWVDWITSTLAGAGYEASAFPGKLDEIMQRWREPAHILPLLSEESAASEWLRNQLAAISMDRVRPIRVHDVVSPPVLRDQLVTELWGILEEQAELRLLDAVDGPAPGWTFSPPANRPPFPGSQTIHNLPPRPNFVGRDTELAKLRDWMGRGRTAEDAKALISGMPGIGKTALAIEAAYRNLEKFQVVWWIRGEHVNEDLAALAERLEFDAPDTVVLVDCAASWLSERHDCLIIIDDVPHHYEPPFIEGSENITLLTSRQSSAIDTTTKISLAALSNRESMQLMAMNSINSQKVMREIINDLNGHPRAIKIASRHIRKDTKYNRKIYNSSIFRKFFKSWDEYKFECDRTLSGFDECLKRLSFFGNSSIPLTLFTSVTSPINDTALLWRLIDTGIAEYRSGSIIKINQPVQFITQQLTKKHDKERIAVELLDIFLTETSGELARYQCSDRQKKLLPCLISTLEIAVDYVKIEGWMADLWHRSMDLLLFCGRYSRANSMSILALRKADHTLFNSESFAKLQFASGKATFALGEYGEAYRALSGAAHLAKNAESPCLAAEAAVWAGHALLRDDQDGARYLTDQYPLARQLLEEFSTDGLLASTQALREYLLRLISAKMHGAQLDTYVPDSPPDEPDTVRLWRMVAEQYLQSGQPDAAGALLRLAEDATAQIWGRGHPEMAETLACLSEAQMAMGDREEAMRNAKAALGIASRKLGRKHPLASRLINVVGDEGQYIATAEYVNDEEELAVEI